ncbi:MAG: ISAzo13-like element transposase-related protein, partial [Stellaceae bacterium]
GRKRLVDKDPTLLRDLDALVDPMARGDPTSPLRWTCKSTPRLARELAELGHKVSQRSVCGLLAHVVMYSVIALALFLRASYREVPRCLLEGLQGLRDPAMPLKVTGKSGISQARTRLGWDALRQLHDAVGRSPCLPPGAPGIARGAWSVSTAAHWMSPTKRRTRPSLAGPAAAARTAPIRRSALCLWSRTARMSCSPVLWRAVKPARVRSRAVLAGLQRGMLGLADRQFFGFALWQQAGTTGAGLLWRIKKNLRLPCAQRLLSLSKGRRLLSEPSLCRRARPPAPDQ